MLSLFDFSFGPHFHYQRDPKMPISLPTIESIIGDGVGWAKEINGDVYIKPVENRTTLHLKGAGAMKINGTLTIGR